MNIPASSDIQPGDIRSKLNAAKILLERTDAISGPAFSFDDGGARIGIAKISCLGAARLTFATDAADPNAAAL